MKKYLILFALAVTVGSTTELKAQFYGIAPWAVDWEKFGRTYKGMEVGFSKGFMTPIFESYYYEEVNGAFKEKKAITKGKLKNHWGFYYGFALRLARIGDRKAVGLNLAFMYNILQMTTGEKTVPVGFGYDVPDAVYSYVALPISIDYKVGAEAAWDKYEKSMFAFGAGICPKFVTAGIEGEATPAITPFIKGEVGYVLGIAFKLRGTYFIGNQVFEDASISGSVFGKGVSFGGYSPSVTVSSGGEFVLSLIVMPFTGSWY